MKITIFEKIIRKLYFKLLVPILAPIRRKKIKSKDFTIIANNCWGGVVYDYFKMEKKSPTIGGYFFADDYIRFLKRLEYYTSVDIKVVDARLSKHYDELLKKNEGDVLVGVLDDIEFICLHYRDKQTIIEKWNRRCKRINYDNLIIKFSYMNNCDDAHVKEFDLLPYKKKICFVSKPFTECESTVQIQNDGEQILNDTFYFKKGFDLYSLLNK